MFATLVALAQAPSQAGALADKPPTRSATILLEGKSPTAIALLDMVGTIIDRHAYKIDEPALLAAAYRGALRAAKDIVREPVTPLPVPRREYLIYAYDQIVPLLRRRGDETLLLDGALAEMTRLLGHGSSWGHRYAEFLPLPLGQGYKRPPIDDYLNSSQADIFEGDVGLELTVVDGALEVASARRGWPAWDAGVRAGDRLLAIDGVPAATRSPREAAAHLGGRTGKAITLDLMQGDTHRSIAGIVRVDSEKLLAIKVGVTDDIAYISLPMIGRGGDKALRKAWATIEARRPRGLILDLRGNRGESFDDAAAVADLFLHVGRIGRIRSKYREDSRDYDAKPGDMTGGIPMVLLCDGDTARGAEMLAAALVGNKRATIVGMPTAGLGITMRGFAISQRSFMTFATGIAADWDGKLIEGRPLAPTIRVEDGGRGQKDMQLFAAAAQLTQAMKLERPRTALVRAATAAKASRHA